MDLCHETLEAMFRELPSRSASPVERPDLDEKARLDEVYDDAYWSALEGKDCDFWPRESGAAPEFDFEQYLPIFHAVKIAASLIYATPEDRWECVQNALREQAEKYAAYMREEAA